METAGPYLSPDSGIRRARGLWLGTLGPPALWLIHLQTIYALSQRACDTGSRQSIHFVSAATLLLILAAAVFDHRAADWSARGAGSAAEARPRFMGRLGLALSALFALVVLAQWIAVLMISPCGG